MAHAVEIDRDSKLAEIVGGKKPEGHGLNRAEKGSGRNEALAPEGEQLVLSVNSSHHQSADKIGKGLRITARCPDDGIIEALEGTCLLYTSRCV